MSHDDRAIPTPEQPEHRRRHRDEFDKLLENAKRLLTYAVDAGIQVDARAATKIIAAIHSGHSAWESTDAGELANAIATLAAAVHPVTPETLRATFEDAHQTIGAFKKMAYWLAGFIVPLSVLSFIATGISATIANDLKAANEIVVTLHLHLDTQNSTAPPPLSTSAELQQFAAQIRDIYSRANFLRLFVPFVSYKSFNDDDLQLPADLTPSFASLQPAMIKKTTTYQNVRLYATNIQDVASLFWGALGNFILPILYALLGACAYVLRVFTNQIQTHTFAPSDLTAARFIIAGIGGGIVGLFNTLWLAPGSSLPPLALAFLIGYAADVFFALLDNILPTLIKPDLRQNLRNKMDHA
jgi:hypothetical protein